MREKFYKIVLGEVRSVAKAELLVRFPSLPPRIMEDAIKKMADNVMESMIPKKSLYWHIDRAMQEVMKVMEEEFYEFKDVSRV